MGFSSTHLTLNDATDVPVCVCLRVCILLPGNRLAHPLQGVILVILCAWANNAGIGWSIPRCVCVHPLPLTVCPPTQHPLHTLPPHAMGTHKHTSSSTRIPCSALRLTNLSTPTLSLSLSLPHTHTHTHRQTHTLPYPDPGEKSQGQTHGSKCIQ